MADKEATLYVVDLGESMGRTQHGRAESDLEWAMTYVWEKITTTVFVSYFFWEALVSSNASSRSQRIARLPLLV